MMLVFFYICIIILCLLVIKFKITIVFNFDAIQNAGTFEIKVINITVYKKKIKIHLNKDSKKPELKIYHNEEKNKKEKKKKRIFFKTILKVLLKLVDIKNINININLGKSDNAFLTAMSTTSATILVTSILSYFNINYNNNFKCIVNPIFNKDTLQISMFSIIYISFADIISSLIICTIKVLKNKSLKSKEKADNKSIKEKINEYN